MEKLFGENTFILSTMEILSGRRRLLQFDQKKSPKKPTKNLPNKTKPQKTNKQLKETKPKQRNIAAGKTELYRMCKQDISILRQQSIKVTCYIISATASYDTFAVTENQNIV